MLASLRSAVKSRIQCAPTTDTTRNVPCAVMQAPHPVYRTDGVTLPLMIGRAAPNLD
jgi:hypothetical protein